MGQFVGGSKTGVTAKKKERKRKQSQGWEADPYPVAQMKAQAVSSSFDSEGLREDHRDDETIEEFKEKAITRRIMAGTTTRTREVSYLVAFLRSPTSSEAQEEETVARCVRRGSVRSGQEMGLRRLPSTSMWTAARE